MAGDAVLERLEDISFKIEERHREVVRGLERLLMKFESMTPEERIRMAEKAIEAAIKRSRRERHGRGG